MAGMPWDGSAFTFFFSFMLFFECVWRFRCDVFDGFSMMCLCVQCVFMQMAMTGYRWVELARIEIVMYIVPQCF